MLRYDESRSMGVKRSMGRRAKGRAWRAVRRVARPIGGRDDSVRWGLVLVGSEVGEWKERGLNRGGVMVVCGWLRSEVR